MIEEYYDWQRKEILPLIPENYQKVLEIGCGTGNFRDNLKYHCEYWGVEPFEKAALQAEKKINKVLIGTYEEVVKELPNGYFDLVICNDVIEHMVDHNAFFQSIKTKMTNDSYLIGSIPNVRCFSNLYGLLKNKEWKYEESGILDYTHLKFFTEKSLKRTLQENGFIIHQFLYLFYFVIRAI